MEMKKVIKYLLLSIVFFTYQLFADNRYDLDSFDDLEIKSLKKKNRLTSKTKTNQKVILFDDNLYLLDDDFDFGEDEFELQKLELDLDDMETAREYEDFLNAFFSNSTAIGSRAVERQNVQYNNPNTKSKKSKKSNTRINKPRPRSNTPQPQFASRPSRGAMGFGVSTIIGATMPVTMEGFSTGSNFGFRIDTPVSFNLAGMEAVLGTDIYFSSFSGETYSSFNITNFIASLSVSPLSSIEFRTGLGITPLAIGDFSDTGISIPFDINYYLPINLSGFKFALNLHGQRTMGYPPIPGSTEDDATDFIYLGLLINTPLSF